jgi:hypothetical protein
LSASTFDGVADALDDEVPDFVGIAETDFAFRGVDVHIDGGGIHVEEEEGDGVLALHEGCVIAFAKGVIEGGVLHGAAIDEDELLGAGGAADAGLADETAEADAGDFLVGDFEQLGGESGTAEVADALEKVRRGRELVDDAVVIDEDEADGVVTDGLEMELVLDVAALGGRGAEEFATRRKVEEQVIGFYLRSGGVSAVANVLDLPGVDEEIGADEGAVLAGGEAEAGDAGDAGDGLAAEAKGGDGGEVEAGAYFAGGVAFEAEEGIVAVHAGAVVDDADGGGAAAADHDLNLAGSGVEGVLDELFDDRGGTLDDLAGGDLAGDLLGKQGDAAHGMGRSTRQSGGVWRGGVVRRRLTSIIPSDSVKK